MSNDPIGHSEEEALVASGAERCKGCRGAGEGETIDTDGHPDVRTCTDCAGTGFTAPAPEPDDLSARLTEMSAAIHLGRYEGNPVPLLERAIRTIDALTIEVEVQTESGDTLVALLDEKDARIEELAATIQRVKNLALTYPADPRRELGWEGYRDAVTAAIDTKEN